MSVTYTVETIVSDKDTHFTGALTQNAIENESLDFPADWSQAQIQKMMITGVSAQAIFTNTTTTLDFEVFLWNTKDFANTDLDVDGYVASFILAATDARQIAGTGQYYYESQSDFKLPIDYQDTDSSGKLHVGLVNRSATTFHADDSIKLIFTAEPVL
tara:strand:+ start:7320 stop:7793 length:474 start_codon:yes stop_codon:yes gene_type:complete